VFLTPLRHNCGRQRYDNLVKSKADILDDKAWERLQYRGGPIKQQVRDHLPESAAPFGDAVWQSPHVPWPALL
jgi:hypothetical protein